MSILNQASPPRLRFSEAGIAPLVIILIVAVTILTGYGAYKSSNQFNIRSDKSVEKSGGRLQNKEADKVKVDLANSGKLAEKAVVMPVEQATDEARLVPQFSITPPAGWDKLPPASQILVEFLSPAKDTIEEGMVYIDIQPNITVFVSKGDYASLDEAYEANLTRKKEVTKKDKTTMNGQETIVTESTQDAADLLRDTLEKQIKQEIAKSGTKISEDQLQKDIEKVLDQAKIKIITYTFYKDGYYINVAGKSLEKFWDKRGSQLKKSIATFKFE